jgi:hypothetical protein
MQGNILKNHFKGDYHYHASMEIISEVFSMVDI